MGISLLKKKKKKKKKERRRELQEKPLICISGQDTVVVNVTSVFIGPALSVLYSQARFSCVIAKIFFMRTENIDMSFCLSDSAAVTSLIFRLVTLQSVLHTI